MTAIELAPLLTAYSVPPSGEIVTADVAAPVYFTLGSNFAGARASIIWITWLVDVSMTAISSALSCATYSVVCVGSSVMPSAFPSSLMRLIRWPCVGAETSTTTTSRSRSQDTYAMPLPFMTTPYGNVPPWRPF